MEHNGIGPGIDRLTFSDTRTPASWERRTFAAFRADHAHFYLPFPH